MKTPSSINFFISILNLSYIFAYFIPEGKVNNTIKSFTFGSCFNGFLRTNMDIFKSIMKTKPDLFIFNGDITYLDDLDHNLVFNIPPPFNKTEAEIRYKDTFNERYYKEFRETTPIIGIWDDHDYGRNNGDTFFKHKFITKEMFLDFLEYPDNHPKRFSSEGVFSSYTFGDSNSHKTFKIILPDLRFYLNNTEMLGEHQWDWLENELKSNETFTFIISGIQFLPANRPFMLDSWSFEGRKRFMELLEKTEKSGVVILSGDVHFAEFLKTNCIHPRLGYHLYEITSSGLSHFDEHMSFFIDFVLPRDYSILNAVYDYNYGFVELDWGDSKEESKVRIGAKDMENNIRNELTILRKDLNFNRDYKNNTDCEVFFNSFYKTWRKYLSFYMKRLDLIVIYWFFFTAFISLIGFIFSLFFLPMKTIKAILGFMTWKVKDEALVDDKKDRIDGKVKDKDKVL